MDFLMIQCIRNIVALPSGEEEKLRKHLRYISIPKGSYYLSAGQVPRRFGFIRQGLCRYLYIDHKGTEYTKNFVPEGHFVNSYSAMKAGAPSHMYIEALEDCMIEDISYTDWEAIRSGHPCWNQLLVIMLEKAFAVKEKRERELLLLEAGERYREFLREFPGLIHRVRQHQIASYLGISPVSLSRIRHQSDPE